MDSDQVQTILEVPLCTNTLLIGRNRAHSSIKKILAKQIVTRALINTWYLAMFILAENPRTIENIVDSHLFASECRAHTSTKQVPGICMYQLRTYHMYQGA